MDWRRLREIQTRRDFFKRYGIGTAALAHLMREEGRTAETPSDPLTPKAPHYTGKAKNVIFLFMEGAPSQVDLFDPKPGLNKWNGSPLPESMTKNLRLAFIKPNGKSDGEPARLQASRAMRDGIFRLLAPPRHLRR